MKKSSKTNGLGAGAAMKKAGAKKLQKDVDFLRIQGLIHLATEYGIAEITFEKSDYKLSIRRSGDSGAQPTVSLAPVVSPAATAVPPVPGPQPRKEEETVPKTDAKVHIVKSPIIGTFYSKPKPDQPPFVTIGTEVTPGKVLCIVEAMKIFNEVECEVQGTVTEVLIKDGAPVEFDQPLFKITLT